MQYALFFYSLYVSLTRFKIQRERHLVRFLQCYSLTSQSNASPEWMFNAISWFLWVANYVIYCETDKESSKTRGGKSSLAMWALLFGHHCQCSLRTVLCFLVPGSPQILLLTYNWLYIDNKCWTLEPYVFWLIISKVHIYGSIFACRWCL